MIPVKSAVTEENHLDGTEVSFSISPKNSAWIMRSLADLYSNRELAVVREYSTNAFDSNKEKALAEGSEVAPIHVTLPTALNPHFVVQDFGVGMSEAELLEIYTQFGESTKRESDDFNGLLGFGSKSAVAYTNTFTVEAVKDGQKNVGVVVRREDSMGGYLVSLKIVLSVETSEPNGVKVTVPVHNAREFEQKARDFYRFWKPGTVLVNGEEPGWAVGEKIGNDLYYSANAGTSYVVMGNVPYRIANPDALFPRGMNRISFVVYVPNGAVEFTPSREDLKYSEHTKSYLHGVIKDFVDSAVQKAKDEIASASNHSDAYKQWKKWINVIGKAQVDDLTYKGDKLEETFKINAMRYNSHSIRNSTHRIDTWDISQTYTTLIVTNFVNNLSSNHKKMAKDWRSQKGISAQYILFTTEKTISTPWFDQSRVVSWEKLKSELPKPVRISRAGVAYGRRAGTFDTISVAGRKYEQDVPSTKPLFYIMTQELKNRSGVPNILERFKIKEEVVVVPANRLNKFLREYPHAQSILLHLKGMVRIDGPNLLTEDAVKMLKTESSHASLLAKMDYTKIDDPELRKWVIIHSKGNEFHMKEYDRHMGLACVLGLHFTRHNHNDWDSKNYAPLKEYPLALASRGCNFEQVKKDIYLYLNAAYAARKDSNV